MKTTMRLAETIHLTRTGLVALAVLGIVMMLVCPSAVMAQDVSAVFDSAGTQYERGDYPAAVALYTDLLDQGYDDPVIWYNLGNAYFKAGQLGRSIKAYLRARRLAPRDPDINANLQFVRLYSADRLDRSGRLFVLGWADTISRWLTLNEWMTLAGALFFTLCLLASLKLWLFPRGRAGWYWLGVGGFVWLLVLGGGFRHYRDEYVLRRGVVTVAETDVRGGPGEDYTLQFTGHDGLVFTIDRVESDWLLVTFENGVKGWVASSAIEPI